MPSRKPKAPFPKYLYDQKELLKVPLEVIKCWRNRNKMKFITGVHAIIPLFTRYTPLLMPSSRVRKRGCQLE